MQARKTGWQLLGRGSTLRQVENANTHTLLRKKAKHAAESVRCGNLWHDGGAQACCSGERRPRLRRRTGRRRRPTNITSHCASNTAFSVYRCSLHCAVRQGYIQCLYEAISYMSYLALLISLHISVPTPLVLSKTNGPTKQTQAIRN